MQIILFYLVVVLLYVDDDRKRKWAKKFLQLQNGGKAIHIQTLVLFSRDNDDLYGQAQWIFLHLFFAIQ